MKNIAALLIALCLLIALPALADQRADMLINAAVSELGYTATKGGYSKFGEWAGKAYGEWCSEFVSWCVNLADESYGVSMLGNDYPMQASCESGAAWFKERGRYVTVNGGLSGEEEQFYLADGVSVSERPYIPQSGDLIYIEWYKYNRLDHVGIVEYVTQEADGTYIVHTIEGNNKILGPEPTVVARYTYRLDDPSIRGYGILQEGLVGTELQMGSAGEAVVSFQKNLK
ncbi:MAG: CHAP domain-containing protein, partial [Clostridia bacterium]|nr:CHAP domain-containing protein [Clostridia bacterium]